MHQKKKTQNARCKKIIFIQTYTKAITHILCLEVIYPPSSSEKSHNYNCFHLRHDIQDLIDHQVIYPPSSANRPNFD